MSGDVEADIVQALKAYAPLRSLIAGRIVPDVVTGPVPCIVYQRISTAPLMTMGRNVAGEDARIQFSAWAKTSAKAFDVSEAARDGVLQMNRAGTRRIGSTVLENAISDYDPTAKLYRRFFDVVVVSTEVN